VKQIVTMRKASMECMMGCLYVVYWRMRTSEASDVVQASREMQTVTMTEEPTQCLEGGTEWTEVTGWGQEEETTEKTRTKRRKRNKRRRKEMMRKDHMRWMMHTGRSAMPAVYPG
jgi:hypothetical protein